MLMSLALSNGRVQLSTGTLYGALRRVLEDNWMERFQQPDTFREKQAYRLTPAGRRKLEPGFELSWRRRYCHEP